MISTTRRLIYTQWQGICRMGTSLRLIAILVSLPASHRFIADADIALSTTINSARANFDVIAKIQTCAVVFQLAITDNSGTAKITAIATGPAVTFTKRPSIFKRHSAVLTDRRIRERSVSCTRIRRHNWIIKAVSPIGPLTVIQAGTLLFSRLIRRRAR